MAELGREMLVPCNLIPVARLTWVMNNGKLSSLKTNLPLVIQPKVHSVFTGLFPAILCTVLGVAKGNVFLALG